MNEYELRIGQVHKLDIIMSNECKAESSQVGVDISTMNVGTSQMNVDASHMKSRHL